MSDPLMPAFHW